MTCIVGLVAGDGGVWMGCDSAGVADYSVTVRADPKVFYNGDFLIGYTSSFRMGQLLQYSFQPPLRHPEVSVYKFMATEFIDAVRATFKSGGFAVTRDGAEQGGCFLVGYMRRLFRIDADYQVGEAVLPFDACGYGQDFARGAIYALRDSPSIHPRDKLLTALAAAQEFSGGVRGPFVTLELKGAFP